MAQTLNQEAAEAYLVIEPRRALANARRWAIAHAAELICAVLLAVMSLQMLVIISRKSITIDEIVFIPSAYYHLAEGNFQFVYEHPPLSKFLAGVPLLLIQPNEPVLEKGVVLTPEQRWTAMSELWEKNPDKFAAMMFWTRVPIIALTVVLGILIFVFARRMFGPRAATLAVALFSLEPTVLAHGRVVQTDIPATFGYLLFFIALYHYYQKRTLRSALWVGAVMGLAFLAKFSMLMLGPLFVLFFIALHARNKSRPELTRLLIQLGLTVLVPIIMINLAYPASHRAIVDIDVIWIQEKFPSHSQALIQTASAVSYLLPTDFVLGTVRQLAHNGEGHPASLLGMYSRLGWWYYFPVAFALKTTIPFLLLSIASVIWAVREWIRKRESRFLWTVGPFAIYTIYLLFSHIDIGVRHYLPAYPFLFILGGALLDRMIKSPRARRVGMIAAISLLGWICAEAWRAFPNHIPYMNQFASSSHPHWWYLSDSNVEWGDDARELALYLQARGETRVRSAFLGDFLTLGRYGIGSITLIPRDGSEPQAAHYSAIGASFLNGSVVPDLLMTQGHWVSDSERVNFFDAYRQRVPEAVFGGSIYLYREDGH